MDKVYVNARFLTQPLSGVQQFAVNICLTLKQIHPGIRFLTCREIMHTGLAEKLEAKAVGMLKGHTWEQFELPVWLRKNGSPLLINLCNTAPIGYKNQLNVIHDVAYEKEERWFTNRFKFYYRWLMPQVARNCKKLLTVSKFSRQEISAYYGIPENNIGIIPNSVSEEMELLLQSGSDAKANELFFLAVGSIDPRKNLDAVISSFVALKLPDIKLKIIGRKNPLFSEHQEASLQLNHPRIEWIEDADNKQLVQLYCRAIALVNLSGYEGFGLTNLEAMACGCPVVISDIPVFHEVCGDAGWYVNHTSQQDVMTTLLRLLQDKKAAESRKDEGIRRSKLFSRHLSVKQLEEEIKACGY